MLKTQCNETVIKTVLAAAIQAVRPSMEFTSEKIRWPVVRSDAWNRKCNVIVRHPPRDKSRRRRREKTRVRSWALGPRQCHWNSIRNLQGVSCQSGEKILEPICIYLLIIRVINDINDKKFINCLTFSKNDSIETQCTSYYCLSLYIENFNGVNDRIYRHWIYNYIYIFFK